jgi:hypothetical protein
MSREHHFEDVVNGGELLADLPPLNGTASRERI